MAIIYDITNYNSLIYVYTLTVHVLLSSYMVLRDVLQLMEEYTDYFLLQYMKFEVELERLQEVSLKVSLLTIVD